MKVNDSSQEELIQHEFLSVERAVACGSFGLSARAS